jgi:hypothetical protein
MSKLLWWGGVQSLDIVPQRGPEKRLPKGVGLSVNISQVKDLLLSEKGGLPKKCHFFGIDFVCGRFWASKEIEECDQQKTRCLGG